jgi:hypothetical protein
LKLFKFFEKIYRLIPVKSPASVVPPGAIVVVPPGAIVVAPLGAIVVAPPGAIVVSAGLLQSQSPFEFKNGKKL